MSEDAFEQQLATRSVALGTVLSDEDRASSEALSDYARSQVSGMINNSVEGWLNQLGTVRSQINLNKHGKLNGSSLDWLVPLYDSPSNILFAQLGARHKDDRNSVNIGIGARFFPTDKWMYGLNNFIDSDITGSNYRLGFGAEAWSDYLKLSANSYQRLSGWHQSRDFADYDERPANGFDLRANGFLPSYPQLGGSLVYEQYFGDEVALFGKDNRQKNPYAVTVGANYTPVPMLTFSAEKRMGKFDQSELTLTLDLTYQLEKTWRENTDPDAVDAMRKLSRSRYDFVERNNDIVLEYRKQQVIRLTVSPTNITGESGSSQTIALNVNSKYGVKSVNWQGDSFIAAGGKIRRLDLKHMALTLPPWQVVQMAQSTASPAQSDASRLLNTYVLTAIAEDNKGNLSPQSQLNVEVLPPTAHFAGDATVHGDYAPPDGTTPVSVQFQTVDESQHPLKGEAVTFNVTFADGTTVKQVRTTDAEGNASADITSTVVGKATVTASLSSGETGQVTIHFVEGAPDVSHSTISASPLTVAANGRSFSTLTLALNDSYSRAVSGLSTVSFTVSGVDHATLSGVQETSTGQYEARLSGTKAGRVTVIPAVDGTPLSPLQAQVTLTSDEDSAQIATGDLTVLTDNAAADGSSQNKVRIRASDAQGNPLSGQTIELSADNSASIAATAITDNQGLAVATLTSQTAGLLTVTATLKGSRQQVQINFVADEHTAQIAADDFSVVTDNAVANLSDHNIVRARVSDRFGNALANQTVWFSADNGATIAATGISDAQGLVNMPLISHVAGSVKVTATLNDSSQTVTVAFTSDTDTAKIADGGLTLLKDNAVTNGSDNNRVEAKVVDANGNALQGVSVTFSAGNGAAILTPIISNSDGFASTTLNNTKAGISKVTASVGGNQLSIDTHFVADISSGKGVLATTADNAVANGSDRNSITLALTDAHNNPLADIPVSLTASNQAMLSTNSGKTSAAGTLTADVSSKTAGVSTITATLPDNQTFKVDVTFVADNDTARVATGDLTVVRNDVIADGVASNQVQVRATDAYGNSVAGQMINFTAANGASIPTSGITGTDGTLKMLVTSTTAGSSTVTASVNGSSQSVVLNFVADDNSAHIANGALTVSQNNAVANGTAVNSVQARVSDARGNPVTGAIVAFSASNGAIIVPQGTTDVNGLITVNLSSKKAGVSTVTATVNGSSQQIDTTFVADGGTAQIGAGDLTVVADNAIANGTAANQVQVEVSDANGNPVTNQAVSFGASSGATIAASGNTDTTGKVQMPVTSLKAGSSVVTATVNGSSKTVTVNFVADSSTAQIGAGDLTVVADNAIANGTTANQVQVQVSDANGNPVTNQAVSFSASNGATIVASGNTDTTGKVQMPVTSLKAGSSVVTATVNGSSKTVTVNFVADSSTAQIGAGDLTVTADNAVADGAATNQLQVKVTDANGNSLAGQSVSFSADNGATIAASATTGADGTTTQTLTSKTAGDSVVMATVNGSSQSIKTHFQADGNSAHIASGALVMTVNGAVADGSATDAVQATVTDSQGNTVAGVTVGFVADNGASIVAQGTTDTRGQVIVTLSSKTAGISHITATVNGGSQNVDAIFVADRDTAQIGAGDLTVVADNAIANGTTANQVQVEVSDANGNPVTNQAVSFGASSGATIAASGNTDTTGKVQMPVTSLKAGSSVVTATVNGSSKTVTVNFVADSSTAQIGAGDLTVVADNAIANGTTANQVQVQVSDANGNPVTNQAVSFSASNGATIVASGNTDTTGKVQMPVTSLKAGSSVVTATVNGSSKTVTVNFVADSSTAQIGAGDLTVMADNALANGIVGNNVQVKVTDSQGNAIAGQDVSFSASNGATIAAQGRTDSNGELLMTVTSKTAGVSTITARVNGSSQQVDVTFVADGGTAQINAGNLTVVTDNAVADGKATNQIQLKVTDANGNAVAGQTVTFSASNGAMIDGSAQTTTAGTLTLDVTSLVSGVSTVTASINGSSQHVDVIFIADNSTAQLIGSNMNIITNHAVADGAMVNAVRILVTDQQGNPVASQLITLSASNGATVAETVATNMAGVATAVLTSTTAGTSTLTATVNGSNQSVDVNFVADANTARIADGDMTVVTDNLLANGTDENQVQVKITDANGNIVAGAKVDFSASHNAVAATSAFSDDNGLVLVPITSTLAGVSTVTATINGSRHSVDVSFNADASTAQIVVGSLIVIINNSLANGSSLNTVQAKVTDAYGNPLVNQSVNFIADNGAKMGRPGLTDENGMIQVGLSSSVAGPSTITAVLNGSTETVVVTFIADTSTAGIAAGDMIVVKDNAFANGSDANNVKMTVKDAKGNVLADQPVTLSADNGATVASSASTDSNGEITVPVTNTLVGSSTLTATTNGSSQSVTVNFVVDRSTAQIAVSDMVVTQNNAVANKSAQNVVQVRVSDSWNNPVPDAVVTFSANNGATVVPEASTDANGLMAVMITSNKAGISTLTAGINSSSRSVDVNFIAATIPVITQVEDVTGSVKGNLTSGQPTDETKPVLQGTAEKNGTVRLYEGSTQIGTATADDTGLWNITVNKALSGDGDHSLTATSALTSQLPESDPSEAFILHLDTVAEVPVITRVQDSSGNLVNGQDAPGGEVDFWGTAEPGATVIIYGVRMKDRIRMAIDSVIADTGGNWHAVMSDERVFQMTSEYQFVPVSTDIAGNSTTMSQATAFSLQYHSWPAPVGTPTYVLAGGDMTEEEMTAQLAATGSLLINIQAGERSARIFLPQSDASNPGQHVYVSNDTSAVAGIYPDAGGNSTILPAGSQTTWYSNGSTWKQMN